MHSLFSYDSPLMRKLALIWNLAFLNILWLVCCLPIFTIGAATAAMHSVLFHYIEDTDDAVIRPFFKAFVENFKQATILWVIAMPVIAILAFDALYLSVHGSGLMAALWIPFAILSLILAVILTYAFPLMAKYDSPLKNIVRNSGILFLMDFWQSLFVLVLNLVPFVIVLILPGLALQMGFLWICFCGSAVSYWNDRILLRIFNKRQHKEEVVID